MKFREYLEEKADWYDITKFGDKAHKPYYTVFELKGSGKLSNRQELDTNSELSEFLNDDNTQGQFVVVQHAGSEISKAVLYDINNGDGKRIKMSTNIFNQVKKLFKDVEIGKRS